MRRRKPPPATLLQKRVSLSLLLIFAPPRDALYVIVRGQRLLICLALLCPLLRSFARPTAPWMSPTADIAASKIAPAARSIARRAGGRLAGASRPPSECQVLSRARKRSLAAEIVSSRCSRTPGSTGTRGPRLQSR